MVPELEIDFDSDTWRVIATHAQAQLDQLRKNNDSASYDAVATAGLRGRIAVWKELLELPAKRDKAQRQAEAGQSIPSY